MDEITFYSDGIEISAWFAPASENDPSPAVIFCPGYTGTKYAAFYRPYIERLTGAGIAVMVLDYRGWGRSGGTRGLIRPLDQVEDIRSGLSYLETRDDVDATRLGIFGVSFGGGHATYVMGVDERVRCGVSVSGIADGRDWLRSMRRAYEWRDFTDRIAADRRARATTGVGELVDPVEDIMIPTPERRTTDVKGQLPDGVLASRTPLACAEAIMAYRPIDVVGRIAPRAMMWICIEDDVVVPSEHSRRMHAAAADPKRLVRLPGREHYAAYVQHEDAIMAAALDWYGRHL